MIVMKLGWLVLEVVLCLCFLYFGSTLALALALLLILVPVGTIPVSLHLRRHLSVSAEVGASQRKGDEGTVIIRVDNPTAFPAVRIHCDVMLRNQLNSEERKQRVVTCVLPKKNRECRLHVRSKYCGRMRVWVGQVVLYDCFGIFGIRCKCDAVAHMTVQPDTFEPVVTLLPNPSSADDSDSYSQERPGADLTETFQIREYVPGDSPRQVHWKLTNKFDRLIVRDPGLPVSREVLVFWERNGVTGNLSLTDAQAEVVISLCRSLVDSGVTFTVGWNDTDRNRIIAHRIREMDEFVALIPRILRATGSEKGVGGAELLVQTRPDILCAHMVYIAEQPDSAVKDMGRWGHVTVVMCGEAAMEGAVFFDPENYQRQLTEIQM